MQNRRQFLGTAAMAGAAVAAELSFSEKIRTEANRPMVKAGIITDMHHAARSDTPTRKYSAALAKMDAFITAMKREKPAFIIELGDIVDKVAAAEDPKKNLREIEELFTSIGPAYHVLGNHEFDNLSREYVLGTISNTGIPQGQTWYSWDHNGVHFIVLDADYCPQAPHRQFDMNTAADTFWNWRDAYIPPQELEWLKRDLAATALACVVFTHQTLDRADKEEHNIKNGSAVRTVLEDSGKVIAVFSGHDHEGGYANIKGIHYLILSGNVGTSEQRPWQDTSRKNGFDLQRDNQFALLEIFAAGNKQYVIRLRGTGRQASYELASRVE
ncbi:MAG: hypothetical protein CSA20_01865 [Deltaproteobacteria bacterium]|nr:MAG: hypothetical protein CSA20_01865 [Deltaproteobacteria bacterium]